MKYKHLYIHLYLYNVAPVLQVKEIIYPLGATIDVREIKLGDETMSVLEIWGAEYQENDALLIKPENKATLEAICARERCLMQVSQTLPTFPFLIGTVLTIRLSVMKN